MRCPRCNTLNSTTTATCGACGSVLPTLPSSARLVDAARTEAPTSVEGEHKQVTVLFCDLVGSTELADRIGPEGMHAFLEAFFAMSMAEVHRYEGTVNQLLGDGFMALFGAPVAHEDHARRAALAALAIQDEIARHRFDSEDVGDLTVSVRIGLNSGSVIVGRMGDGLRSDYTAVGDTTHLAARMQQLAEPGAVYVTETTRRLIDPFLQTVSIGERHVKGKRGTVGVFRLSGARRQPEADRRADGRTESPLIGREAELDRIGRRLEALQRGEGGVVSILAEAGLGKSRVIAEARAAFRNQVRWLEGRALSYGLHLSFYPFLEIIRAALGILEDESDQSASEKLQHQIAKLFPEDGAEILPYLSTLLSLPVSPDLQHRVAYLDGHATGLQVFRSVLLLFERLAKEHPLTIVFEDFHWADQSSGDLLEHLLVLPPSIPLLLIIVARPERESTVERLSTIASSKLADRFTEILLAPLAASSSLALLDHLVSGEQSADFKRAAMERADGNPFFLEEIVRGAAADGLLKWSNADGGWVVVRGGGPIRLPLTLHDIIAARIDRLDPEVKQLLKIASVVGRSFLHRVLLAIGGTGDRTEVCLRELEALELIREKRRTPEIEYFFKHALVQETAYATMLASRRRDIHGQVGQCIEQLFVDRLEDFYGLLAYHYARADAWQKAQEYLLKAGDQAARIAADAEALAHYQAAMAAYERAFGDRWDTLERAALERKIGEALFRLGHHQRALALVMTAKGRLHRPLVELPTSVWGIRLAIGAEVTRRTGRAALARLFVQSSIPADPRVLDEIARTGEVTGWIDYFLNPERFFLQALEGLSFFERRPHAIGLIYNHMSIGLICDVIPLFGLADRHHRRSLAIATDSGQPIALGHARLGMGIHLHSQGELRLALDEYERASAIFREMGHMRGWGGVMMMRAWALEDLGDFEGALPLAEEIISAGNESADPQLRAWGLQRRGASRRHFARIDEAFSDLRTATALAKEVPDHASVVQALALLGSCHRDKGELDAARESLDEANRVRDAHKLRGIWVAHAVIADAELSLAELDAPLADRRTLLKRAARSVREAARLGTTARQLEPASLRLVGNLRRHQGRLEAANKYWERSARAAESAAVRNLPTHDR